MAEDAARMVRGAAVALLLTAATSFGGHPVAASVNVVQSGAAVAADAVPQSERMRVAREALTRVLAEPEFQRSAAAIWVDKVRSRLTRWMADVLERMGARRTVGRTAAKVLAWVVGLGALAAMALWLVRSLVAASERKPLGFAPAPSARRSARAWARDAVAAHRAGHPRDAARCAFHAAIAHLEEHGAWRADESRTPREYLRLLPYSHRHRPAVAGITHRFEQAWYGSAEPTAEDSRAVLAGLKELGCLASDQAI